MNILLSMRIIFTAALFLFVPIAACAQSRFGDAKGTDHQDQASALPELKKQAEEAHRTGRFDDEIEYRQRYFRTAWAAFALNPNSLDEYHRYNIVFFNDLPLGLLLEGAHRFSEAEAIFRHNQIELAAERIAGNDSKSINELQLAHLLENEGKDRDAKNICSHWKGRMRHLAGRQDSAHIYGIPKAPISDTPEAEVARWDLACGESVEGLILIKDQISAHPGMLASLDILRDYYYSEGDFQEARKAESDGTSAITGR
ncbi:MAG: hypothetical protein ABSE87_09275 [Terracidiphilus sp.]